MKCQDRVFPSWNRRGGCASKKKARSLRSGADGVVIMVHVDVETLSGTDHPVCAFIRRLRSIFLMAQPPLLSELIVTHISVRWTPGAGGDMGLRIYTCRSCRRDVPDRAREIAFRVVHRFCGRGVHQVKRPSASRRQEMEADNRE